MISIVQYPFYPIRKDTQEKNKKWRSLPKKTPPWSCVRFLRFSVVIHGTFSKFGSSSSHFLVTSRRHFRNSGAGCIGTEDHFELKTTGYSYCLLSCENGTSRIFPSTSHSFSVLTGSMYSVNQHSRVITASYTKCLVTSSSISAGLLSSTQ